MAAFEPSLPLMPPSRTRPLFLFRSILAASVVAFAGTADASEPPRHMGWLEWSWLEPGHIRLRTKLDTGARTSSLHAENIEPFERDGEKWVRFRIPLSKRPEDTNVEHDVVLERRVAREIRIKEHHMASMSRYVVEIELCLGGETRTTEVSLVDRSRFTNPLLLGRLGMRGHIIVDPNATYLARRCTRRTTTDDDATDIGDTP